MIDLEKIENEIVDREKDMSVGEHSLVYMLLLEIKSSAKRWFIIAMVELFIILGIVGGMIWYNSLPVEEISVENDEGNANYIGNDMNGEIYNGEDKSN